MESQQALIEYKGEFTFDTISQIINSIKPIFDELGEKVNTYKKVLIIMVETMENISKYLLSLNNEIEKNYPASILLRFNGQSFNIVAINPVRNDDRLNLTEKINAVMNKDKKQLKHLYQQIISNGQFTKDGGAGLGFIEIAKASNNNFKYSFEKIDNHLSYFTLYIDIIKN